MMEKEGSSDGTVGAVQTFFFRRRLSAALDVGGTLQ
jgi:hypothetical protein